VARIRTIKPEFWDSPRVAETSLRGRLLYIAMWNWADDFGIGDANAKRLMGFAFPNDEITASEVPTLLAEMQRNFSVVFYEFEGRPVYYIPAWEKHQRTEKKAKQRTPYPQELESPSEPRNDAEVGWSEESVGSSDASVGDADAGRRNVGNGNRGTGEEGTGEQVTAARADVTELCSLLADLIEDNGSKRPTVSEAWTTSARLMLDRDGRTSAEASSLIRWCQEDGFWKANILSMPKFREQYDKLRLQHDRPRSVQMTSDPRAQRNSHNLSVVAQIAEMERGQHKAVSA